MDRFGGTVNSWTANQVAPCCVSAPEVASDPERTVRLVEAAFHEAGGSGNVDALSTLGAAFYRAGGFDEAIRKLEEAIQTPGDRPSDWAFLAMAHNRLGNCREARRWLDRLRHYQPSTDPARFWDELEIRLLRGEAEVLVLLDPAFPDDPFAR
jgi:tetratricopeptide (TPR) repeat protein